VYSPIVHCSCVAMKRSELKARIREAEAELQTLRSNYDNYRVHLTTLDERYREIEGRLLTPCRRYEDYCVAIEEAIGETDDDGEVSWASPQARLTGNSSASAVGVRQNNARRHDRRRPRLTDRSRYQEIADRYQRIA
jgi:chromosome segregation ATPase